MVAAVTDEPGPHADHARWLERLAPFDARPSTADANEAS